MTQEQLDKLIEERKKDRAKENGEEYIAPTEIVDRNSPEYLKSKIDKLQEKLNKYEENGIANLYYSLNRKANEMAEIGRAHV